MTAYHVKNITRTDTPFLTETTPIRRAAAALADAQADAAPVLGDDGTLIGILSQKDCFRPALHASYHREWAGRVADCMSRDVVTIQSADNIIHAAEMFLTQPHRVFPVLKGDQVLGLLYRSDVLALLMKNG